MQTDKDTCHNDNEICHMEVDYDTGKSPEGAAGGIECKPAGDGTAVRGVPADRQSDRAGGLPPSVTLALTIAKVCGVTVEDVFYLKEEEEK